MTMSNDFIYTTFIRTTPEKVWAAITTPEFTRQYWGGHVNISNWKKDAEWQHEDTGDNNVVRVAGKVLEIDPPKRLVLSWFAPDDVADSSTVTFEIEQVADMVRLDVLHGEFKPGSVMAGKVSKGWPLVLSSLKSFLETGKAIDIMGLKQGCGEK
jgi:uncharacterized protein YndB with AHSA1/START domain